MKNINTVVYFLVIPVLVITGSGFYARAIYASDLEDLQTAREKAQNDYAAAVINQKASTPSAQQALRHQIVDPVMAGYKDFFEHKLGDGPRGTPVPMKHLSLPTRAIVAVSGGNRAPAFQGITPTSPAGNGEAKPSRQDFVLDGSKIPKELSFGKESPAAAAKKAGDAGQAGAPSNGSGNSTVKASGKASVSTLAKPAPQNVKQFKETNDLLKLDQFSAPAQGR